MKTEFDLETHISENNFVNCGKARIIGTSPKYTPYVSISITGRDLAFIKDKDLERFAVNILKALKSKRLRTT